MNSPKNYTPFFEFCEYIYLKKELSYAEKILIIFLFGESIKLGTNMIEISFKQLQRRLTMSIDRVKSNINSLEYKGYLYVHRFRGKKDEVLSNKYEISVKCTCRL
jgi:DNA-binding MarR family transcriptional regulator